MQPNRRLIFSALLMTVVSSAWANTSDTSAKSQNGSLTESALLADDSFRLDTDAVARISSADSLPSAPAWRRDWKDEMKRRHLDVRDTNIVYPKFIDFCIDIYRWAEDNFNTYDPDYVSGTGKHGKVRLLSDNWTDIYFFHPDGHDQISISSDPYANIGFQANYSVLSISYSVDLNSIIYPKRYSKHKKLNYGFSCARLLIDGFLWENDGTTFLRRIGADLTDNIKIKIPFDGLHMKEYGLQGLYIFNWRRYSHAAAYNLSNYQKKSCGSWLTGATGIFYDVRLDFSKLPSSVNDKLSYPASLYKLHYNSISLMGGYGYNHVWNSHFLYNITTLPTLGLSISFEDSQPEPNHMTHISTGLRLMSSATYTNRQFFATAVINAHGNILWSRKTGFMQSIVNLQLSTGFRF